MKKFSVLATTYTAKQLGDIDIKAFRSKSAYRYRQDIFPDPGGFGVKILAVVPEIVETSDGIYTHRLKLTVFFPANSDDKKLEKYKAAIELKTKRFDIVRSNEPKRQKPVVSKPVEPVTEPEPAAETKPAEEPAPAEESAPAQEPEQTQEEVPAQEPAGEKPVETASKVKTKKSKKK